MDYSEFREEIEYQADKGKSIRLVSVREREDWDICRLCRHIEACRPNPDASFKFIPMTRRGSNEIIEIEVQENHSNTNNAYGYIVKFD